MLSSTSGTQPQLSAERDPLADNVNDSDEMRSNTDHVSNTSQTEKKSLLPGGRSKS